MATVSIVCEQAIFTSARSATGQGYRIVAASKGLRAEEKQKITRCSPSHESLCLSADRDAVAAGDVQRREARPDRGPVASGFRAHPKPFALSGLSPAKPSPVSAADAKVPSFKLGTAGGWDPSQNPQRTNSRVSADPTPDDIARGAAFYSLPGGRWCIALSRHAGAEHSGRGGQCVHTHNIIVTDEDLARCAYNPMAFIRTLLELPGEYGKPNPSGILPSLELQVNSDCPERLDSQRAAILPCDARVAALQILLEEKSLVVDLPKDWLLWAEALLLAVPGPMRRQISFAAGLRFSLGRGHTLHVLRDEKNAVQGKVAAQGIPFVEATSTPEQRQSAWISFAGRHWSSGDLAGLSRRTSRPFDDCSMPARERIAELYNSIDSIPQSEAGVVLNVAIRSFDASQPGEEEKVCIELREAAVSNLQNRLASQNWIQLQPLWDRLVALWQKGGKQAAFVQPLVNIALSAAVKSDPLLAAELAIAVARPSSGVDLGGHQTMLQHVLTQLCGSNLAPSSAERMANLIGRWRAARPTCSLISQLTHLLAQTGFQQGA